MSTLVKIITILIISTLSYNLEAQNITVNINNLQSNTGKVMVALYNTPQSFLKKSIQGKSATIANGTATVVFNDVAEGVYAIGVYHDENDNNKMDTNFIGIPKEDYGCSNDAKGFMGPPKWDDAKFSFSVTQTLNITIQ